MRAALAVMALIAALSAAHAFGLGEGNRFGRLGSVGIKKAAAVPGCSGTGLIFNVACNSQYVPTL